MKKVKILLDSTGDIPKEWLEKYDVSIVPLHITWPNGDKEDDDTRELKDLKEYWKKLRETDKLPVSSNLRRQNFLRYIKKPKIVDTMKYWYSVFQRPCQEPLIQRPSLQER